MNSPLKKANFPYRWFRWVPPAILFIGALMPIILMVISTIFDESTSGWHWGVVWISLFLMIIPLASLGSPIVAGIIGLVMMFILAWLFYNYALFQGSYTDDPKIFQSPITILIVIGSALSIIYGIIRWWWRRKNR